MAGTALTQEIVEKLLDKLGSDDNFRAAFQENPDSAMTQLGGPANFTGGHCMKPKKLASKEEIQRSRATIHQALLGQSSQEVFCLDAK